MAFSVFVCAHKHAHAHTGRAHTNTLCSPFAAPTHPQVSPGKVCQERFGSKYRTYEVEVSVGVVSRASTTSSTTATAQTVGPHYLLQPYEHGPVSRSSSSPQCQAKSATVVVEVGDELTSSIISISVCACMLCVLVY